LLHGWHCGHGLCFEIQRSTFFIGLDRYDCLLRRGGQRILGKNGLQGHLQGLSSLTRFQVERWFSEAFALAHPDLVGKYLDIFVSNDRNVYLESCLMLGAANERVGLSLYKGPCEVMVGEEDYATPPLMAEEIARILPQARLSILEGVRHYSPIEAPSALLICSADSGRLNAKGLRRWRK